MPGTGLALFDAGPHLQQQPFKEPSFPPTTIFPLLYEQLLPEVVTGTLEGLEFHCVSLRRLIILKRAAGRRKDLNVIAELEALLEEQERTR